jgi:hypothetical protein
MCSLRLYQNGIVQWKVNQLLLMRTQTVDLNSLQLHFEFRSENYDEDSIELVHQLGNWEHQFNQRIDNGVELHTLTSDLVEKTWAIESSKVIEPDGLCCQEKVASITFFITLQRSSVIQKGSSVIQKGSSVTQFLMLFILTVLPLVTFLLNKAYKIQYGLFSMSLLVILMDELPLTFVLVVLAFNFFVFLNTIVIVNLLQCNSVPSRQIPVDVVCGLAIEPIS